MASERGQTPRLQRSDQDASADARGPTPYAGHNITGTDGVIAVDKVGNVIRFYDPESLREIKSFPAPEPAAHELAISHDRRLAFVPLYGDGIYGNNRYGVTQGENGSHRKAVKPGISCLWSSTDDN